jgi:hypothetical protein
LKGRKPRSSYIVAVIVAVIAAGLLFWNQFKYRLVNKKIDNLVSHQSGGLYSISYQNLVIDEALGDLSVENIEMTPDTLVYRKMITDQTAPADLFFIRIPVLKITGVKTPKALLNKEIVAHLIRIENAQIEFRLGKSNGEKKLDFKKVLTGDIYRQLLGNLKSIQTDSIVLENASFTWRDVESKSVLGQASGLSIRFAGTVIDSSAQETGERIIFSSQISVHCNQLRIPLKNKIYDFMVQGLDYNSSSGNLRTGMVRLKPRLSENAFAKSNKFAKDRMDISIGSFELDQISRDAMLEEKLMATRMKVQNASIRVFRDKSYPHDSVDRTHDYPQEAIMRLPFPLYIQNVQMTDGFIEYREKNDRSDSTGSVSFFHIQAGLDNVTNMEAMIQRQNKMLLQFHALFLNQSVFEAKISMRLNDNQGRFHLDARLDSMSAESLNPLLKPMALAELDKGNIDQLIYHFDATNLEGTGTLEFRYRDLSVRLLKKDDDKNLYKTKGLPTLAAGILLKHSNPAHGKTRTAKVDFTRDIHRSIFNFMWKSLFSGIKQIAL